MPITGSEGNSTITTGCWTERVLMRAMLLSALTALTFTAANAAEKDTSSATYMLPYCKLTTGQVVSGRGYEGYLNGECFGIVEGIRKVLGFMRVAGDFGPLPCTTI